MRMFYSPQQQKLTFFRSDEHLIGVSVNKWTTTRQLTGCCCWEMLKWFALRTNQPTKPTSLPSTYLSNNIRIYEPLLINLGFSPRQKGSTRSFTSSCEKILSHSAFPPPPATVLKYAHIISPMEEWESDAKLWRNWKSSSIMHTFCRLLLKIFWLLCK